MNYVHFFQGGLENQYHITVLLGGTGEERDVSLRSGKAVIKALQTLGHYVHRVDPQERCWQCLAVEPGESPLKLVSGTDWKSTPCSISLRRSDSYRIADVHPGRVQFPICCSVLWTY